MARIRRGEPNRRANIWVARIIPVILLGIIGYATYVVTKLVCADYLLNPSPPASRRTGAAIAILVIYFLLLIPVLVTYTRLIHTILTNPGFVPRGAQWQQRKREQKTPRRRHHKRSGRRSQEEEKPNPTKTSLGAPYSSDSTGQTGTSQEATGQLRVEEYWLQDVFVCNYDGRPAFCSTCLNFKPDRTHHCSEVDRCVRKMDHFCPWVGGIVSETSFKFFIQFTFYAALYCTHTLVFMAYFFAERRRNDPSFLNVNWVLILAFAGLFLFFSGGIFGSSFQLAVINSTTVENLSRKTKVYYLAVHIPRSEEVIARLEAADEKVPRTIAYPRPPEETQMLVDQYGGLSSGDFSPPSRASSSTPTRIFAILESPPGFNPWSCGPKNNMKEVMGYTVWEWLLPVKQSPCASHTDGESMFKLNPQIEGLKRRTGLVVYDSGDGEVELRPRRKRRRRRSRRPLSSEEPEDSLERQKRRASRRSRASSHRAAEAAT